jgi:choline dehydrogenase-like flavoprotein
MTVRSTTSRDDLAVVGAQQEIVRRVWRELAEAVGCDARAIEFADYNDPVRTNAFVLEEMREGTPATWSSCLGTEDHEGGTLPLGAVLDDDHEFAALRGLYAAGPSSFPRLGAANPGLTILALAQRLAAKLHERL